MNPYRYDIFLKGMLEKTERFISLHDELEGLLVRVSGDRPAAISMIGPWGIGKSFTLQLLADLRGVRRVCADSIGQRFHDDPKRLCFVLLETDHPLIIERATQQFLPLLYDCLLEQLTKLFAVPNVRLLPFDYLTITAPSSIADLNTQLHYALEQARATADDTELFERFDAHFGRAFPDRLIALLQQLDAWNIRVIFLIDSFDSIAPQLGHADFDQLRTVLATASMVIATRQALSKLVTDTAQSSPFFNLLEKLNLMSLHFLSTEEACRLIIEPPTWFIETASFRFSEADIRFILNLTGTHPDIIRASCEYLYTWVSRQDPSNSVDLLPSAKHPYIRALLHPLFANSFAVLWYRLDDDERVTLINIAQCERAFGEHFCPPPQTIVSRLIERGYIIYEQEQYHLFSGLFCDYVLDQAMSEPPTERPMIGAPLTELETKLLDLLKSRHGEIVERDYIVTTLYGVYPDEDEGRRAEKLRPYYSRLDALMFRLRSKLENEHLLIENIRGQGYRIVRISGS